MAATRAEHVQVPGVDVLADGPHDHRQRVHAAPHVHRLRPDENPHRCRQKDHDAIPRATAHNQSAGGAELNVTSTIPA